MTSKEFADQNIGRRVRISKLILRTYSSWSGWEGEIIGYNAFSIKIKTSIVATSSSAARDFPKDSITNWEIGSLELIEDDYTFPPIKENISICSKCNKSSCFGMDRIECLLENSHDK